MPEKEFSDEEILRTAEQLVFEIVLTAEIKLFEALKRRLPRLAKKLERDFKAWIAVWVEVNKEKGGEASIKDVRKRLSGNSWDYFLSKVISRNLESLNLSAEEKKIVVKEFREAVERRLRKLDIH